MAEQIFGRAVDLVARLRLRHLEAAAGAHGDVAVLVADAALAHRQPGANVLGHQDFAAQHLPPHLPQRTQAAGHLFDLRKSVQHLHVFEIGLAVEGGDGRTDVSHHDATTSATVSDCPSTLAPMARSLR